MKRVVVLISCLLASAGDGSEIIPAASARFAAEDASETPDFQRHVSPLLGRLGCNGRACHGSRFGEFESGRSLRRRRGRGCHLFVPL